MYLPFLRLSLDTAETYSAPPSKYRTGYGVECVLIQNVFSSLSLCISPSSLTHACTRIHTQSTHARTLARTHAHTHARARARAHTHTAAALFFVLQHFFSFLGSDTEEREAA